MTLRMLMMVLCVLSVNIKIDFAFASGHHCSEYGKARNCHAMWSRHFEKCQCI